MQGAEELQKMIDRYDNIVFFGGAGVSTESGIPDFRSTDGLYHQEYDYPPETILSHTFFLKNPEEFYRFYRAKMLCLDAQPNAAHKKLAELEEAGKLKAVVTREAERYSNFTAACTGISVPNVTRFMTRSICCIRQGSPAAAAAAG